jgi:hypothetical protein
MFQQLKMFGLNHPKIKNQKYYYKNMDTCLDDTFETKSQLKTHKLINSLELSNDIQTLYIVFVDNKDNEEFKVTINGSDNIENWSVQSDKISQDISTALEMDPNATEVILKYNCTLLIREDFRNYISYQQIWDVIQQYVNYHGNQIGEIFSKKIIDKCLINHCDDKKDGQIFEDMIGFNRYICYSVICISDYLLMKPLQNMACAFMVCKYFKYESLSTVANNADPAKLVWSNFEECRQQNAVLPTQISDKDAMEEINNHQIKY